MSFSSWFVEYGCGRGKADRPTPPACQFRDGSGVDLALGLGGRFDAWTQRFVEFILMFPQLPLYLALTTLIPATAPSNVFIAFVIGVIAGLHYAMSWAAYKNSRIERWFNGTPTLLIENGHPIQEALAKERVSPEELLSQVRLMQVEKIAEVKKAYLEPDGKISVLKKN